MKTVMTRLCLFACAVTFSLTAFSQLPKLKAPSLPKVPSIPGVSSGSKSNDATSGRSTPGGKDESGLFSNVTDDENAFYARRMAVEKIKLLNAAFAEPSVDYPELRKLIKDNENTLANIQKLEPNVNRSKYDEQYLPLKARADKDLANYDKVKEMEENIHNNYYSTDEVRNISPLNFRMPEYGYADGRCYCFGPQQTKGVAGWEATKRDYEKQVATLQGYSSDQTQRDFARMQACLKNGNAFALWASKENLDKEVLQVNAKQRADEPQVVIDRCTAYFSGLERIETDQTLDLDAAAKAALAEAKATCNKVKADAEQYVSSGAFKQHLADLHAAKIAKVFMSKAGSKQPTLEAAAAAHIKSENYSYNSEKYIGAPIAVTLRTVCITSDWAVEKNDIGIPEYEYHTIEVAFKTKENRCFVADVVASHTYKGGGTYATVTQYYGRAPIEMACENVSK